MIGGGAGSGGWRGGVSTDSQGDRSIRKEKKLKREQIIIKKHHSIYMTEISPERKLRKKKKKIPTQNNADYFPLTAFQQTVPDWIPAISNVKKDS